MSAPRTLRGQRLAAFSLPLDGVASRGSRWRDTATSGSVRTALRLAARGAAVGTLVRVLEAGQTLAFGVVTEEGLVPLPPASSPHNPLLKAARSDTEVVKWLQKVRFDWEAVWLDGKARAHKTLYCCDLAYAAGVSPWQVLDVLVRFLSVALGRVVPELLPATELLQKKIREETWITLAEHRALDVASLKRRTAERGRAAPRQSNGRGFWSAVEAAEGLLSFLLEGKFKTPGLYLSEGVRKTLTSLTFSGARSAIHRVDTCPQLARRLPPASDILTRQIAGWREVFYYELRRKLPLSVFCLALAARLRAEERA